MTIQTIATLKTNMPIGVAGGITAQDMQDFIDTTEDLTTQQVLTKTANYTATASDNRRRIVFNAASAVTLTLPSSLAVGWECLIFQLGAGQVAVAVSGTGAALRSHNNHTKTGGQYAQAYLWCYANAGTAPQVALSGDTAV